MKNYGTNEAEFKTEIQIPEPTDPAHADVINTPIKQLFGNTVANKKAVEESKEQVEAKLQAFKNEISASQAEFKNSITNGINDIASRITRLEDAIYNNLVGNSWILTFSDLDGVNLVKGNYNKAKQRLEC